MSTETFTTTLHSKRIILMSSLLPFLVHQLITGVPAKGLILRRTWAWRSACMAPWTTIHLRKPLACHLLHLKCSLP
jgi:type III secretory pathway component EscT